MYWLSRLYWKMHYKEVYGVLQLSTFMYKYASLRITITNNYSLQLKRQWSLSKKMLKLTDDKSTKVYVSNMMGLIRTN